MRESTKQDTPQLNSSQSQCPICWKMFSTDGVCEQHKPYARSPEEQGKRGRVTERDRCSTPKSLGMTAIERSDGIAVWGFTSEEEYAARLERMDVARAARKKETNGRVH